MPLLLPVAHSRKALINLPGDKSSSDLDLPFALFYALEPGSDKVRLIRENSLGNDTALRLGTVLFDAEKNFLVFVGGCLHRVGGADRPRETPGQYRLFRALSGTNQTRY